ncbi:hypothetical protein VTL71DRAFT_13361 [Oculimacula yallundae]|uniref:Myb-like DNA-binding domain-containing protein n=1 Tax=Oculimacula yallundae TaxID=86028 RepID=A0ABR4CK89_9HELO
MPSKIQLDENLWFLYICLQKSDLKAIDFNAVGLATSLKPPAARMRYTRLKRQIESGALNTSHGPGFSSSPPPPPSAPPFRIPAHPPASTSSVPIKRKRARKLGGGADIGGSVNANVNTPPPLREIGNSKEPKEEVQHRVGMSRPSDTTAPALPGHSSTNQTTSATLSFKSEHVESTTNTEDRKIKLEYHSASETDIDTDSGEGDDSEDEMPLAKLCKRRDMGLGVGVDFGMDLVSRPAALKSLDVLGSGFTNQPVELKKMSNQGSGPGPIYSTFSTSREGFSGTLSRGGHGNATRASNSDRSYHTSMINSQRYVPLGFNPLPLGLGNSGNGARKFDGQGFRDVADYPGAGLGRREGVYASPYAGWIDGRMYEDQGNEMGHGWERYARFQGNGQGQGQLQQAFTKEQYGQLKEKRDNFQERLRQERLQSQKQDGDVEVNQALGGGVSVSRKSI